MLDNIAEIDMSEVQDNTKSLSGKELPSGWP